MARSALLGLKRIFFDRIFERSYWTWRKHPSIMIPTMLQTALQLMLQAVVTLVVVLLVSSDPANPQLARLFRATLGSLTGVLLNPAFWLTNIPLSIAAAGSLLLIAVVGSGWVYASEYGIYVEAWNSDSVPVSSVISNGSKRWGSMAWTLLVSNILTWGPAAIGLGLILLTAGGVTSVAGFLAQFAALLLVVPLFVASLIMSIFTIYSYPAVAVDGASGLGAVLRSFSVASHNLGLTLTYAAIRIIFYFLLLLLASFESGVGVALLSSLAAVVLSFALTPVLHLTKTMIYYHARPTVPEMSFQISNPIWEDALRRLPRAGWTKVKSGLAEGAKFVISPGNLPFHLVSAASFALGIYAGYYVSVNGVGSNFISLGFARPGHGNPEFSKLTAALPAIGVNIFLNNWLVSIATALSGLGFGAPSFVTMLFNGFILGVFGGPQLVPSTTMFLAAILPHGIIEIPSFVLSGSVGVRLGYAALKARFRPGLENDEYLSKSLRVAVYLVVGLAPLFLIAGLIEADVTPIIMRMFGWVFP